VPGGRSTDDQLAAYLTGRSHGSTVYHWRKLRVGEWWERATVEVSALQEPVSGYWKGGEILWAAGRSIPGAVPLAELGGEWCRAKEEGGYWAAVRRVRGGHGGQAPLWKYVWVRRQPEADRTAVDGCTSIQPTMSGSK
jgi:hypothetical protein